MSESYGQAGPRRSEVAYGRTAREKKGHDASLILAGNHNFGEAATQYEGGVPVGTEGSWKAGLDGATPGIVMEGDPRPGDRYRQAYSRGVAEDMAKVLNRGARASVPYGSFHHCLKAKEWSLLEPGAIEHTCSAPNVGLVLIEEPTGTGVRVELVDIRVE